ncbi:MAG: hypothetical protein PWP54_1232 [Thermosipho sp. (in: thermotogales)]|nr:hypothetical protein [Thermosipho sp. (in: thermotogales)]MDN5325022.1 hypothetical protein [Thermosipho sp. (in: thermotogales)]
MPRWWNWQTRMVEGHVGIVARAGSSPALGTKKVPKGAIFFRNFLKFLDVIIYGGDMVSTGVDTLEKRAEVSWAPRYQKSRKKISANEELALAA